MKTIIPVLIAGLLGWWADYSLTTIIAVQVIVLACEVAGGCVTQNRANGRHAEIAGD